MSNDMKAPARIWLDGDVKAGNGMFPRCFENPKYCSEPAVEYALVVKDADRDANWRPAVDYWRDRAEKAETALAVLKAHLEADQQ